MDFIKSVFTGFTDMFSGGSTEGGFIEPATTQRPQYKVKEAAESLFSTAESLFSTSLEPIKFQNEYKEYREFSNYWQQSNCTLKFSEGVFEDRITKIKSSEHIFQALKVLCCGINNENDEDTYFSIIKAFSPGESKRLASRVNDLARKNGWAMPVDQKLLPKVYIELVDHHFQHRIGMRGLVSDYKGAGYNEKDKIEGQERDWSIVGFHKEDAAMLLALRAKSRYMPSFKDRLIKTGDRYLVENFMPDANGIKPGYQDPVWGNGYDGKGQNRLGLGLMIHRLELLGKINKVSNKTLLKMITTRSRRSH